MKHVLSSVPPFFRSFYFLSTLFFVVWMSFIDSNDWFSQGKLSGKKQDLAKAKTFYQEKIIEVKNEQAALHSNPELLEKLAREKYLMKKETEDLYIVVND